VNEPANLATKDFWEEDYYRGIELPARPDPGYPFDRCLARALEEMAPVRRDARIVEIGCAPARWLVWYAERFGASVVGLEYSRKGAELARRNLASAGVTGEVHEGDLFSDDVSIGMFDLVLSLGVIEHFDDIPAAFARHVAFVGEGGRLVLGMPNFRGLIGFLQRWADRDHLELHNRDAMNPDLYAALADARGLRLEAVRYLDGVDPDMVRVSRLSARVALMPLRVWRKLRVSDRVNGRLISSYLLLVFARASTVP
jgi:SAM-dependent methyltransferase